MRRAARADARPPPEPQAAPSTAGAEATFSLTGRTVAFVSRLGPTKGKAMIYVDGTKVASIDL